MTIKSKTTKTTFLRQYYMTTNLSEMDYSKIKENIEKEKKVIRLAYAKKENWDEINIPNVLIV